MAQPITIAQRLAVEAGLRAGHAQLRVSADVGVSVSTVALIAIQAGLGKRGRKATPADKRERIEAMIREGRMVADILREERTSWRTIKKIQSGMEAGR